MRRLFPALFCSLVFSSVAAAAPGAVHCAHLLDVRSGEIRTDQTIVFAADGTITNVGPAKSAVIPPNATAIEVAGTCLPGLIDMHTHVTFDPQDSGYAGLGISVPREAITGVKNARRTLYAGFTTIRNVGASGFTDVALRDAINDGDVEGPRMLVSGPPLGITGGHCDDNLLPYEYHHVAEGVADGPWAARAKVRETIKYGADLIKICASGGVLSKGDLPGTPQYTLEEMIAIAEEAHKLGRKVAAHAHGTQSIKDAIRAGIDTIEHSSLIDDEGIALAKEHGTYLVFDIYNDDFILQEGAKAGMLPESIEKEKKIGRLQRENFRHAFQNGAKIAFGTDSGVYPHGDNAKQFAKMVEWGMQPIDAIRAATLSAALALGWSGKVGTLEPGAYADIIAVQGKSPLADVTVLQSVSFVMKGGAVVRNDQAAAQK
ncbi:MAG TPA: amidohydrolase family protein [Candidatus Acidoferrum sp.]|nr:amidohydrolase family protein [Candidatus Acidoferrum sp.]